MVFMTPVCISFFSFSKCLVKPGTMAHASIPIYSGDTGRSIMDLGQPEK
jgi:hypothetical protein